MTGKQQRKGQRQTGIDGQREREMEGRETGKRAKDGETKTGVGQGIGRQKEKAGGGKERRGGKRDRDMDKWTVIQKQEHIGGAHERGTGWNTDRQTQRWEETDRDGKEGGGKKERARERVRQGGGGEGVPEDRRHINMEEVQRGHGEEERGENKERGESGRKGSNTKRGERCVKTKTKTKMGLVTAMVGAAGLALSLGPLYSHPGRRGHSSKEIWVGGRVGLVTAGQQRTCSLARPDRGAGIGVEGPSHHK